MASEFLRALVQFLAIAAAASLLPTISLGLLPLLVPVVGTALVATVLFLAGAAGEWWLSDDNAASRSWPSPNRRTALDR